MVKSSAALFLIVGAILCPISYGIGYDGPQILALGLICGLFGAFLVYAAVRG
jgi:hypothetical protein